MPKIQENQKGGFFLNLPSEATRALGWKKGTLILCEPNFSRKEIVLREAPNQ